MLRHGIEARRGNRLLAGSVHESPAPKGDARRVVFLGQSVAYLPIGFAFLAPTPWKAMRVNDFHSEGEPLGSMLTCCRLHANAFTGIAWSTAGLGYNSAAILGSLAARLNSVTPTPQTHRQRWRTTNEALPQTDEACGGCGSGRRFMTSFGITKLK